MSWLRLLLPIMVFLCITPSTSWAEEDRVFEVESVTSRFQDQVYFVNAVFEVSFPDYIVNAVDQGFALPLVMEIEVYERRAMWFDRLVTYIKQQYLIHYHPLLDAVSVHNVNSGQRQFFADLNAALEQLAVLLDYPMLDLNNLAEDESYRARMRFGLDQDKLPLPLKSSSLWENDWNLVSDWKEWGVMR